MLEQCKKERRIADGMAIHFYGQGLWMYLWTENGYAGWHILPCIAITGSLGTRRYQDNASQ